MDATETTPDQTKDFGQEGAAWVYTYTPRMGFASVKPNIAISLAVGAGSRAPKRGVSFLHIAIFVQLKAGG
jgi:hypothetical protein